jgi:hypothetical protein
MAGAFLAGRLSGWVQDVRRRLVRDILGQGTGRQHKQHQVNNPHSFSPGYRQAAYSARTHVCVRPMKSTEPRISSFLPPSMTVTLAL